MLRVTADKKPFKFTDSILTDTLTLSNGDLIVTTKKGKFARYVLATNEFKKYAGHTGERRNPKVAIDDKTLANHLICPIVNGAYWLADGSLATSSLSDGIRIWNADTCELKQHIALDFSQLVGLLDDQLIVATDSHYADQSVFHLYRKNTDGQYVVDRQLMDTSDVNWKPGHLFAVSGVKKMVGNEGVVQYLGLIGPKDDTVVCYWDKKTNTVTRINRALLTSAFEKHMSPEKVDYIDPHLLPDGQLLFIATLEDEFISSRPRQWYFLLDLKTKQIDYFGMEECGRYFWSKILSVKGRPVLARVSNGGKCHFLSGFERGHAGFGTISTYTASRGTVNDVGTLPDDRIFVRDHQIITLLSFNEGRVAKCGELRLEHGKYISSDDYLFIMPLATGDFYGESQHGGRVVWDGKTGKLQQLTELGKEQIFSDHPHPLRDGSILAYSRRGQLSGDYFKVQAFAIKRDTNGFFSSSFPVPREYSSSEWKAMHAADRVATVKKEEKQTEEKIVASPGM